MELGQFLKQRDVIYTLCAASISTQIVLVADLITNSCIMPIIDKNHNDKKIENFTLNVKGAKIELGKLLIAIVRILIIILILYIIYYLTY